MQITKLKKLPKIEQQAIEEFKDRLIKKLGDNLVMLKLYGSKARGDWHGHSDIDILIVANGQKSDLKNQIYDILFQIEQKYNYNPIISPTVYSLRDYLKHINPISSFLYTVKKNIQ